MKITCAKCGKVVEEDNSVKQQTGILTNYFCSEKCTKEVTKKQAELGKEFGNFIWFMFALIIFTFVIVMIFLASNS